LSGENPLESEEVQQEIATSLADKEIRELSTKVRGNRRKGLSWPIPQHRSLMCKGLPAVSGRYESEVRGWNNWLEVGALSPASATVRHHLRKVERLRVAELVNLLAATEPVRNHNRHRPSSPHRRQQAIVCNRL
jgi:hypothetical protein